MTDTETTTALALPTDAVLNPEAWRTRTDGAFRSLRQLMDAQLAAMRNARTKAIGEGQPLRESDVAEVVQRVFGTAEEMRTIANGFKELAEYLDLALQEEVGEVNGRRVVIGDAGTEIVAGWNRGSKTEIDHGNVDEALTAKYRKTLEVGGVEPEQIDALVVGYQQALMDAREYGKLEYGVTKLKALKSALQGTGDTDVAGLIEAAIQVVPSKEEKFTAKREEARARR